MKFEAYVFVKKDSVEEIHISILAYSLEQAKERLQLCVLNVSDWRYLPDTNFELI